MQLNNNDTMKFFAVSGWTAALILTIALSVSKAEHENIARRICQIQANGVYVSAAYGSPCITKFSELEKLNAN